MSDTIPNVVRLLRGELAAEVASDFPRLRRIPETDVIWFLDYFPRLSREEQATLLDELAESAAWAFFRWREMPQIGRAVTHMCEVRNSPGAKGGTRYTDVKMMCADKSLQKPENYHPSWRVHLTPLHFQPRADLLPDFSQVKPARAPLVRKLVNKALSDLLGSKPEKMPGGVSKCIGRCGAFDATVRVDFGGMLTQLGYTVTFKNSDGNVVVPQIFYERLWGSGGRWDYLTEENAPRSIAFFAEHIAYLADLVERVVGLANA
jgi:hypothetical protein